MTNINLINEQTKDFPEFCGQTYEKQHLTVPFKAAPSVAKESIWRWWVPYYMGMENPLVDRS